MTYVTVTFIYITLNPFEGNLYAGLIRKLDIELENSRESSVKLILLNL